jgi:thiamine-monophosphate kinase
MPAEIDSKRFFRSLLRECARLGIELAGGDLARSPTATASLTLIGRKEPRGRWLQRSLGGAGDALWVGGTLGESAAGRLLLARGAQMSGRRVDLPKGMGADRGIAAAARRAVRRHLLPIPQLELGQWLAGRRRLDQDPLELCLTGGEDYVLLFTLPRSAVPPSGLGCTRIGRLTGGQALQLATAEGTRALAPTGWDHFETDL